MAPASASFVTMAFPNPRLDPVTKMFKPERLIYIISSKIEVQNSTIKCKLLSWPSGLIFAEQHLNIYCSLPNIKSNKNALVKIKTKFNKMSIYLGNLVDV